MAEFLTVPRPVTLGANGLFAVQAGVPLSEAMDALGVLLDTAEATTLGAAACGQVAMVGGVAEWTMPNLPTNTPKE